MAFNSDVIVEFNINLYQHSWENNKSGAKNQEYTLTYDLCPFIVDTSSLCNSVAAWLGNLSGPFVQYKKPLSFRNANFSALFVK